MGEIVSLMSSELTIPVALGDGRDREWQVTGTLASPGPLEGRTVQLLLPGGTYGRVYWDFPYRPEQYSYVKSQVAAGYATLALDRIGVGASSRPPGEDVTTAASAHVCHQVIQGLRDGTITGTPAARIVVVGHSYGSMVATLEAATYQDIDGLVVTGMSHTFHEAHLQTVLGSFYPVQEDPRFAGAGLPEGYVTTRPGTRGSNFYFLPEVEPEVLEVDERTKETFIATGEGSGFASSLAPEFSRAVTAPVLSVLGEYDAVFDVKGETPESTAWGQDFHLVVVPGAGHNLNLHRFAPDFFATVQQWLDKRIGPVVD
jgi:pimeloyl-ACP methyl ester carboxylesterase